MLLQQTVRSSQYDKYFCVSSRSAMGSSQWTHWGFCTRRTTRFWPPPTSWRGSTQEKDEVFSRKEDAERAKWQELSERLGMLMETIQAKDEVIMKLSRQLSEQAAVLAHLQCLALHVAPRQDQLELGLAEKSRAWLQLWEQETR